MCVSYSSRWPAWCHRKITVSTVVTVSYIDFIFGFRLFHCCLLCLYVHVPPGASNLKGNKNKKANKSSRVPNHQTCWTPTRCEKLSSHARSPSLCFSTLNQGRDCSPSSCISVSQDHLSLSGRSRRLADENRPAGRIYTWVSSSVETNIYKPHLLLCTDYKLDFKTRV